MADEPVTEAAPAFVVRMQVAIAAAFARHRDQLDVHHEHLVEAGVDGWQSKLSFAGHPEVEAVFWYDSADRDVMFWGDAPYREWFLLADAGDETLDKQDVEACRRCSWRRPRVRRCWRGRQVKLTPDLLAKAAIAWTDVGITRTSQDRPSPAGQSSPLRRGLCATLPRRPSSPNRAQ